MIAIERFDHFVLTTNDIEASLGFYVGVLELALDSANDRFAVKFGRQKINFHRGKAEFLPAARNVTIGCANYCLATDSDIESVMARLERHGVAVIEGKSFPRQGARGPMQSVYVRDPDNNLVEIAAYGDGASFGISAIDHMVLDVADLEAAARFYTHFLGMQAAFSGNVCTVSFGTGKINLHTGKPAFKPAEENIAPGSGDFCLVAAGDIGSIHNRLLAANAPLEPEMGIVRRTGATGPIDSLYLRDPDGNLVEVCTPAR